MSAKKFFEDNIKRTSLQADPHHWHLNNGLLALAKQQEHLEGMLISMQRQLQAIQQEIQRLKSR